MKFLVHFVAKHNWCLNGCGYKAAEWKYASYQTNWISDCEITLLFASCIIRSHSGALAPNKFEFLWLWIHFRLLPTSIINPSLRIFTVIAIYTVIHWYSTLQPTSILHSMKIEFSCNALFTNISIIRLSIARFFFNAKRLVIRIIKFKKICHYLCRHLISYQMHNSSTNIHEFSTQRDFPFCRFFCVIIT